MPTYDYKCEECGKVFEIFRRFSELDKQANCPNCGSEKAERIFSVPHIEGETVTGFNFITEFLQNSSGIERGMNKERGWLRKGHKESQRLQIKWKTTQ